MNTNGFKDGVFNHYQILHHLSLFQILYSNYEKKKGFSEKFSNIYFVTFFQL